MNASATNRYRDGKSDRLPVRTYGEFVDSVSQTEIFPAQMFLKEWKDLATEKEWKEYRQLPLTRNLVLNFADDMAIYFRARLKGISGEELWNSTKEEGHRFLREVHAKAGQLGIEVEADEIDVPLTITDLLVKTGAVEVIK
jgi:hypothetical protein